MRLRCQVDHSIRLLVGEKLVDESRVDYVAYYKAIVGRLLYITPLGRVTRIGQLIEVNDSIVGVVLHKSPHNMRADKPCSPGNNNFLHNAKLQRIIG